MAAATITALNIFPIKSIAGVSLPAAQVLPEGLAGDRRWVVADSEGRAVTGREVGELVRIAGQIDDDGHLHLSHPGHGTLALRTPQAGGSRATVNVWGDEVSGVLAPADANEWMSEIAHQTVRLLYMPQTDLRTVDDPSTEPGDVVAFADAFPLLLIAEASLEGLNERLDEPVPMSRFRPNIVVQGCEAHAEDGWRKLKIGAVELQMTTTCERCVFTTVDGETGERHPRQEPLRTLSSYRRQPGTGPHFGINLVPRTLGTISVGDTITLI